MSTKDDVVESFASLLEERPYSRVSVMDICDRACVSNKTLYRYFGSKNDIVREIIRRDWTAPVYKVREALSLDMMQSATSIMLERNFLLISKRSSLYRNLLLSYDRVRLEEDFFAVLAEFNRDIFHQNGLEGDELDFAVMFFSSNITSILRWWLLDHDHIPYDRVAKYYNDWAFARWLALFPVQGS